MIWIRLAMGHAMNIFQGSWMSSALISIKFDMIIIKNKEADKIVEQLSGVAVSEELRNKKAA